MRLKRCVGLGGGLMNSHFSTYYLGYADYEKYVVYGNGHAENPSNCLWIVIWPDGYWS